MVTKTNSLNLQLTQDEAYTLQLLLGFVANDNDVYSLIKKLGELTGYETDMYDFERVAFSVEGDNSGILIGTDPNSNVVIRIN